MTINILITIQPCQKVDCFNYEFIMTKVGKFTIFFFNRHCAYLLPICISLCRYRGIYLLLPKVYFDSNLIILMTFKIPLNSLSYLQSKALLYLVSLSLLRHIYHYFNYYLISRFIERKKNILTTTENNIKK